MSKKHNTLATLLLLLVGIVMVLEVNSSDTLILILVKLVGLAFTISGSYMMNNGGARK
nr:MAG TPA: hypothetical protein [Caudoviricetes sp.]